LVGAPADTHRDADWRQRLITEYADRSELHTFQVLDWESPSGV